ncbi:MULTISPECIES: hypothetical protein [Methylobacter]
MSSWDKSYNPELIVQRMEKVKTVSGEGQVTFIGFEYSEHLVLLNSMVKLDDEVPEIEKRRIINQAAFKAGAKGRITASSILSEICRLEKDYLLTDKKKFHLITDISISRWCQLPKVRFDGSCIVVHAHLNKVSQNSRYKLMNDAKHSISNAPPRDYAPVSVSVTARSTAEAANKALDRLDFVRGVWNLWGNLGQTFRNSSGKRKPVNTILLGPIHTLHQSNGDLATETWWYEPQYQGPVNLYNENATIENMYKYMASFRSHLKKSKYESDIILAVVRYVRALDSQDWDDSFLRLWSVLEFLTGTQSDSYKVTIRRASYMFADKEYELQILSHLREYRNKSVHAGSESNDIESLMYQLKRYVETLIEFHVGNKFRFSSIADAAEFMDFPIDKALIDRKINKLRYAKQFMSGS